MAVERVKKITVTTHVDNQDELVDALQRLGTVHLRQSGEGGVLFPKNMNEAEMESLQECLKRISEAEFVLDFLKEHTEEKPGFIKTLVKPKYTMTLDEFLHFEKRFDLQSVYGECFELEEKLILLRDRKNAFEQEIARLRNWKELATPMERVAGGRFFGLVTTVVPDSDLPGLIGELENRAPESALDVIEDDGRFSSCIIAFHIGSEDAVMSALASVKHKPVALKGTGTPEERVQLLKREIGQIEEERKITLERAGKLSFLQAELNIAREYYLNRKYSIEAMAKFGKTAHALVVEGWVTEGEIHQTVERFQGFGEETGVDLADPGTDEDPPVSLKNQPFVKPFELITKLYGPPSNREYDPTWIIAISFIVFFGFCIGDVGYGLVLTAVFLLMRKYLPVGKSVADLFLVMCYGSGFAILVGVLTGSWFGIDTAKLPSSMQSAALFDPLRDPIPLMAVCMLLGVIHMTAGTIVEFRDNWRCGKKAAAVIDQGLVLLMIFCLPAAVALLVLKVIPGNVALTIGLVPVAGMLLLFGRGAKSIPGKAVSGLYETYSTVIGWMGDTISYLRLYALGMATFVIGWVVNILAGMVGGIAPVIGIVLMIVVLVVGHTFNVTINLLGAFVHPLRLEFVEFFGKFYEDGGNAFSPFKIDSKIVMIEEDRGQISERRRASG